MFGIDGSELAVIAIVALVVIGPKDLPRVMRLVGQWVGKGRAMSRHVRAGFDTMMREAELEEMQKQWDAQNAAIIASTQVDLNQPHIDIPATQPDPVMLPLAPPQAHVHEPEVHLPEVHQPEVPAEPAHTSEAAQTVPHTQP